MSLFYSRYQLTQRSALNRMDLSSVREGVLISNEKGVGCIQPWPELGDPTLDQCILDLENGDVTNKLVRRALDSLDVLRLDENRVECNGVTNDSMPLESHATLLKMSGTEVMNAVNAGFTAVKVKRGKDWMRMRKKTSDMMNAFPFLRWRFDFNGALTTPQQLSQFLGSIPAERVDFIEDPFTDPDMAARWRGVPIGYDRVIPEKLNLENGYLVAKPALHSNGELKKLSGSFPERVLFTSYMDHPIGQLMALKEAETFYKSEGVSSPPLCGLVTHGLYLETAYSRVLGDPAPHFTAPMMGAFSELLSKEEWRPVSI